ncbi:nucleoside triphosphate pyrophosphohydrolase [Planctomicrobium sp. SH668]|uniref:nucleoside triphosphate pyrophosphohydrolase n=1 Tax=Planctomicrobium sp. SH668 TaxID=3448126 RepID=UPI003F5B3F36
MSTQGIPPAADEASRLFVEFCNVVAKLRSPEGCPWDREQTMKTIKPYTLEETYELLEAIDADDNAGIQEELGDVLLQVVLDAQIAADEGRFTILEVLEGITKKMVARHPHVFGDESAANAAEVRAHWERVKSAEKKRDSALDGIPPDLPALAKAARITKKAAGVGYDFPHRAMLFDKLREEVGELRAELDPNNEMPDIPASVDMAPVPDEPILDAARLDRIEGEIGDVLFVIANIARRWGVNPEEALRRSNAKFSKRFQHIEHGLKLQGKTIRDANLQEMETLYQERKQLEKAELAAKEHQDQ